LVRCLFLLHSLFLCVAYAAGVSFDKKGLLEAVQMLSLIVYIGHGMAEKRGGGNENIL
jgi:hypothetical protein